MIDIVDSYEILRNCSKITWIVRLILLQFLTYR